MTLFQLIRRFVYRHWRAYIASAGMLTGISILSVFIPRRIGAIIDQLVAGELYGGALLLQLAIPIGMSVVIYFLRVGWRLQLFAAAYRFGMELRTNLYERMTLQGAAFYQQQRTGDLMALATNDIDAIEMAAGEAMLAGYDGSTTLVIVLGMMILGVDWRLALVALLPFPFMAVAFWIVSRRVHDAWRDSLDRFSKLNDHVQETLSGVRTLRALGLEARSARQFAELAEDAAASSLTAQRWEAAYEPAVGITLTASATLTLVLGGYLVWQGQLTIGSLTSFSMYLGQLIWPMFAAGWVLSLLERGKAAWKRLEPVLKEPLAIDDHGSLTALPEGELRILQLSYAYPGQQTPALDQVTVELAPGKTLGLVGATGAGKSTLLRLILRQNSPQGGSLLWGGHALDEYRLETLRAAISWVPQESFLFSATIADNIALAKAGASREEIEHVARLAAVHDDIMRLPKAYDTLVGERGVTLSGGQRQRVAIARALLADSPLLLLDDALSAVDTGTEAQILGHLQELRARHKERSVIIVSHRLSSVADADHIVVLKHGRIVETGDHQSLLAQNGWYAAQWQYQQLEESLDAL
ncbi:MAG TPA: ABC transporter transmembrane domain-containing protein [Burkholderiaceae bacterium]|jgi:ATP-binding cassette subfamily B protein/ATP-binding cassette subfamily C protein/ATP-binding cassette subfamily B multidrug efflux pump